MTSMAILVLAVSFSAPAGQDPRAEAERLARSGARQQALERFQALAAANPADIAARLWIGRLHLEMNQPVRAVAVYESIVATEGQNVDALVGLGVALTRAGFDRRDLTVGKKCGGTPFARGLERHENHGRFYILGPL